MPESPRWRLSLGDDEASNKYFKKSAKINKTPLDEPELDTYLEHQVCMRYALLYWTSWSYALLNLLKICTTELKLNICTIEPNRNEENQKICFCFQTEKEGTVLTLFKTPNVRNKSLIVCVAWFSVSIVFFGMNFNVGKEMTNVTILDGKFTVNAATPKSQVFYPWLWPHLVKPCYDRGCNHSFLQYCLRSSNSFWYRKHWRCLPQHSNYAFS